MAEWKSGNWSYKQPPLKDGDTISGGNYSQIAPGTILAPDVRDVTVTGGNFVNCDRAECEKRGWKITGGNWVQLEWCSNEHPELIARGLKPCAADCAHRGALTLQAIPEAEYRQLKLDSREAKPGTPTAQVVSATDADGVTTQTFQVQRYTYSDKVVDL
jgi:hypothetical protein